MEKKPYIYGSFWPTDQANPVAKIKNYFSIVRICLGITRRQLRRETGKIVTN